jgi:tRNA C32,U32 (ribose-2'-O)-methylase TrmJ
VPEAYEYAVSAGHLLDSAVRHESTEAACADTTLVFATSARTRDAAIRLLTPRQAAAEAQACAARGGRVALLFGSERTGLSNSELALAHAVVCCPTASLLQPVSQPGAGGRYSLNLSHAVSILAYELFQASQSAEGKPEEAADEADADWALNTGGRARLVSELSAALRALQLFRPSLDASSSPEGLAEAELEAAETRALGRAVSGAVLSKRAAQPLFQLARRVLALQAIQPHDTVSGGPLDEPVLHFSRRILEEEGVLGDVCVASAAVAAGSDAPKHREALAKAAAVLQRAFRKDGGEGLNLSKRELARLLRAIR